MNRSIKVMLVDDEIEFTSTLSKRLVRQGMDVVTAPDGSEAYSLLESSPFDVVVLDVALPGVNGVQVLKAIKQRFHGVEVLILTGHGSMTDGLKSLSAGAFDFLFKPTRFETLVSRISDAASSKISKKDMEWATSMAV